MREWSQRHSVLRRPPCLPSDVQLRCGGGESGLKIVHIITSFGDGGAEGVRFRLCPTDEETVHEAISLQGPSKFGPLPTERGRLSPSLMLRLCRTIRAAEPDVLQTWRYHADLIGGAMARLAGVPVSWGVRQAELHPQKPPRATRAVANVCAWRSHAVPAKIGCCDDRVAQVHAELGYAPHRLEVICNGFNVDVFKLRASTRHQFRRAWGVCEEAIVIGCVTRFDPQKDHANLRIY